MPEGLYTESSAYTFGTIVDKSITVKVEGEEYILDEHAQLVTMQPEFLQVIKGKESCVLEKDDQEKK